MNMESIENNAKQINEIVEQLVGDNLVDLDNYIAKVRNILAAGQEILDVDLARIIEEIPVKCYHLIEISTQIEMKKGVAKETAKYAQNDALLNATGTVADKSAKAENATAEDRLLMLAYNTAAALVAKKQAGAEAILESCRLIQRKKIAEMKLTGAAGSGVTPITSF